MGFSCEIFLNHENIAGELCDGDPISYKLFGLGPNSQDSTPAPYRLEEIRSRVANWPYKDFHRPAAQECFLMLQAMARANLESISTQSHCETCSCKPEEPKGWSRDAIESLLEIDAKSITSISGGY